MKISWPTISRRRYRRPLQIRESGSSPVEDLSSLENNSKVLKVLVFRVQRNIGSRPQRVKIQEPSREIFERFTLLT